MFQTLKTVSKMSANIGVRLKSEVVVTKTYAEINRKKLLRLEISEPKQKSQSADSDNRKRKIVSHERKSEHKKILPSIESLKRHSDFRPLGVNDDWGPLTHKHELMPMDNVRYWHQHRCETCDKLFEHKHKQRGDQSMNYNKHICNVCGGTAGSRRVSFKNRPPAIDLRKIRY
ncbi:hypothetical protein Bhyg_02999 [Pseudolycoriella hygida]|uniref:Uncharacterized protein n=1 Tax=Pseudolycoriella hygida TaxID=35572 RepID=A0A9Q0NE35_9DIPT|nr:hypothetical protein Bhyg_02999 [Pseudolycoriella hygida]